MLQISFCIIDKRVYAASKSNLFQGETSRCYDDSNTLHFNPIYDMVKKEMLFNTFQDGCHL